jgi:hypothetical protein
VNSTSQEQLANEIAPSLRNSKLYAMQYGKCIHTVQLGPYPNGGQGPTGLLRPSTPVIDFGALSQSMLVSQCHFSLNPVSRNLEPPRCLLIASAASAASAINHQNCWPSIRDEGCQAPPANPLVPHGHHCAFPSSSETHHSSPRFLSLA